MDVGALISAVKQRRCIWDTRDSNHSNRPLLEKLWREISEELDADEFLLRKKWKYLRDQFSAEHGKLPPGRPGESGPPESKWMHYQKLSFLKEVMRQRPRDSKATWSDQASFCVEVPAEYSEDSQYLEHFMDTATLDEAEERIKKEPEDVQPEEYVPPANVKRKRSYAFSVNEAQDSPDASTSAEDDEDLLFFRSLLSFVRTIPKTRKLTFRNRVHELVSEFACLPPDGPTQSGRPGD